MRFELNALDGAARTGRITTSHGTFATPAFMPVGTYGTVKALTPDQLTELHITGTRRNDRISVVATDAGLVVVRRGSGSATYPNHYSLIRISAARGNDRVIVDSSVHIPALVYGGRGNDTITTGSGDDTIFGGGGKDRVLAWGGDDLIVSVGAGGEIDLP